MAKNIAQMMLYRDPSYMGGKCACCRKRQRVFDHKYYPSMCSVCIDVKMKNTPAMVRTPREIPMLSKEQLKAMIAELDGATNVSVTHTLPDRDDPRRDPQFVARCAELGLTVEEGYAKLHPQIPIGPGDDVQNLNNDLVKRISEAFP